MSKTNDIPPGPYRLGSDVQNPRADRRHTRDWRKAPWWKKGTQFVVKEQRRGAFSREYLDSLPAEVADRLRADDRYTVIELAGDRWPTSHRIGPGDEDQYAALAAALVPNKEETLDQFMTRIDCQNGFVEWLVEHGMVQRADLERWWHRYQYGEESEVEPPAVVDLPVHDEVPASKPVPHDPTYRVPELKVEGGVGSEWGVRPDDTTLTGEGD